MSATHGPVWALVLSVVFSCSSLPSELIRVLCMYAANHRAIATAFSLNLALYLHVCAYNIIY